jgi:hypothetical protein
MQLARGSARLDHRLAVDEYDFAIAKRVAFDSLPPRRRQLLEHYMYGTALAMPKSTRSYGTEELEALGLISNGMLSSLAKSLIVQMEPQGQFTKSPPSANQRTRERGEDAKLPAVGGNYGERSEGSSLHV